MEQLSLIASYGLQMTIVFISGMLLWLTLIIRNEIKEFLVLNRLRLALVFANFWILSAGLVLVPNFALVFGGFGFNADQSTAGIAVLIMLAFMKAEPIKVP